MMVAALIAMVAGLAVWDGGASSDVDSRGDVPAAVIAACNALSRPSNAAPDGVWLLKSWHQPPADPAVQDGLIYHCLDDSVARRAFITADHSVTTGAGRGSYGDGMNRCATGGTPDSAECSRRRFVLRARNVRICSADYSVPPGPRTRPVGCSPPMVDGDAAIVRVAWNITPTAPRLTRFFDQRVQILRTDVNGAMLVP